VTSIPQRPDTPKPKKLSRSWKAIPLAWRIAIIALALGVAALAVYGIWAIMTSGGR